MSTERKTYSAKCPSCGRVVRIRPCCGDWIGDALYVIRHKRPDGTKCDGHYLREIKTHEMIEPTRK